VSSPSYELGSIGKKLRKMTLEQFRETCDPAEIIALRGQTTSDDCYAGHNVVLRALGNPSPRDRVGIVTDLLDHGWEVGRMDLFMLLENKKRDVPVELPLVERLLAGGSDPNYLERRGEPSRHAPAPGLGQRRGGRPDSRRHPPRRTLRTAPARHRRTVRVAPAAPESPEPGAEHRRHPRLLSAHRPADSPAGGHA